MTSTLHEHPHRLRRLKGFDYTHPGAYFVTLCAWQMRRLFGEVVDGEMVANENGEIVQRCWLDLPQHYANVTLDAFVVMPNHVHMVIGLHEVATGEDGGVGVVGAGFKPAPTVTEHATGEANVERPNMGMGLKPNAGFKPASTGRNVVRVHGLPEIVRAFKTFSARKINEIHQSPGVPVWQRNYYEHVVRDEGDLRRIIDYIQNNPRHWEEDQEFPGAPIDRFKQEKPHGK